jgi:hypothetical protein
MSVLYFRSKNGNAVTLDHDGIAVGNLKTVRPEGVLAFADILREDNQGLLLAGTPLQL